MSTDSFSSLPNHILHQILFLLPAKDAALTSILSKSCQYAWESLHSLTFDLNESHFLKNLPRAETEKLKMGEKRKMFAGFVDKELRILQDEKVKINMFKLKVTLTEDKDCASRINKWIALAARNPIKEFDLRIKWDGMNLFQLSQSFFGLNSFTKLRLHNCKFLDSQFEGEIKFTCLKELHLKGLELEDKVLQKLVDSSPSLEKFVLKRSGDIKHLQIRRCLTLKIVVVDQIFHINIEAPNLEKLHWFGIRHDLNQSACSSPKELNLNDATWSSLKELSIHCNGITNEFLKEVIRKSPRLETLELYPPNFSGTLRVSSQWLKHLKIDLFRLRSPQIWIETPSLQSYTFSSEGIPAFSSAINSRIPEAELSLMPGTRLETNWFNDLRMYLGQFQNCKVLSLFVVTTEYQFLHEEMVGIQVPPLPHVETLEVEVLNSTENYSSLLDGVFWSCHPKILSVFPPFSERNRILIKFFFETLTRREESLPQCCRDIEIKCWKHYLKDFEIIQGLPGVEDVKALSGDALIKLLDPKVAIQFKMIW